METLSPDEYELIGSWDSRNGKVVADSVCKRIEYLVSSMLCRIGTDSSGWCVIYQDPSDKRYWRLSYPQSELHGGGPPALKVISKEELEKSHISSSDREHICT